MPYFDAVFSGNEDDDMKHAPRKSQPQQFERSPITCASRQGHNDIVILLLKHGAKIDDDTLRAALSRNHFAVVQTLIEKDAKDNGNLLPDSYESVLRAAVQKKKHELVTLSLSTIKRRNLDMNATDKHGINAFAIGVDRSNFDAHIFRLILDAGSIPPKGAFRPEAPKVSWGLFGRYP
ncbi:hypothetical protein N7505_007852 [Penicillium chrysogenum]|uniref:Ankyrin repeat protein n=1 Tax=Penicillium chrysogenum TaxID=5076 RepID=A0ABQ8WHF9_PENCH|nr:hypothetical protein N7505_007852 [Penicillium chrysogenum]